MRAQDQNHTTFISQTLVRYGGLQHLRIMRERGDAMTRGNKFYFSQMKPSPKILITVFFFSIIFSATAGNNFVHRDGQILRDSAGNELRLRGVNLGGWLLWESWIWGGKFTAESTLADNLATLVGADTVAAFRKFIYDEYINAKDIKAIGDAGFNVVRVPLNHRLFDSTATGVIGWRILDTLLGRCERAHVYVVLDLHSAPGGQSPYFIADPEKDQLWKSKAKQDETVALWKRIATRYQSRRIVAGYDMLNEPIPPDGKSLVNMYQRIIAGIREVDQNHLVIIEGKNFAKDFSMFTSLPDQQMAFSFHLYTWFGGDPMKKMQPFVELSKKFNVPVWCGEFGENTPEVVRHTVDAFSAAHGNFSGWAFWTWKKAPNSYPALNGVTVSQSWKDMLTWCHKKKGIRPTSAAALTEIQNFKRAVLNGSHNTEMMNALKSGL